jgi:hypothetical protein
MAVAQVTGVTTIIVQHERFRDPATAERTLRHLRHLIPLRSRRSGAVLVCP